jgi:biopolymer transport protein TolR
MPNVVGRGGSRHRRSMNEINMVPFIDVMLVLLIIFMVSAPLITTGVLDLPSVGQAKTAPQSVVEIIVGTDERLRIKVDGRDEAPITLPQLAARVKQAQLAGPDVPAVISAERTVKYEAVVRVMESLRKNNVPRVGLLVKQGG